MSHGILWEVPQKVLIAVSKMVLFLMSVELFPALSLSQLLFIFLWTELLSITKWRKALAVSEYSLWLSGLT